jgi:hypothetical protein
LQIHNSTLHELWRRGWAFDVALARLLALLLRGPAPSYAPHEGDISPSKPLFESHPLFYLSTCVDLQRST